VRARSAIASVLRFCSSCSAPCWVYRLQKEYEEHAALVSANGDDGVPNGAAERHDLLRQVRLGVLEHKRRAITELRDQNRIDDIVLRELQAAMDLEEVRLLDPADTD
jgi:CPA1 family monovalent cation:H+ antiporter